MQIAYEIRGRRNLNTFTFRQKSFSSRSASQTHSFVAARRHEMFVSCESVVTEKECACRLVPTEISQHAQSEFGGYAVHNVCTKSGVEILCCRSVTVVISCAHNDYCSATESYGLSRLQQVIAIQSGINFQLTVRSVLHSIGRCLRDDVRPLLNRAARIADRTRDRGSVAIVIRQNVSLSHAAEGTAC